MLEERLLISHVSATACSFAEYTKVRAYKGQFIFLIVRFLSCPHL